MSVSGPDGQAVVRPLRPYVALPDDEPVGGAGAAAGATGEPVRRSLAVRPFLVTAGRVTDEQQLPLETQVVATAAGLGALSTLTFEQHDIVAACGEPLSLAEIAARLHLHLNVVRVLAGDLRSAGQLTVHAPQAGTAHDLSVLRRVIEGLRAVPDSRGLSRDNDRPA